MPRILIIDDDHDLRTCLRLLLERSGYETVEAAHGRAGLKVLSGTAVDLVITDILMPEMEGIEFILALRKDRPHLPVIAISGGGVVDPVEYLQVATLLGAVSVLTKPFDLGHLCERVKTLLAASEPAAQPPGDTPRGGSPAD